jgi:Methane oxygenase PmoA
MIRLTKRSFWIGSLGLLFGLVAVVGLRQAVKAEGPKPISIELAGDRIDFRAGKSLVASYHFSPKVAKPYFWPVNSPDGTPLTRGWPMEQAAPGEAVDHIHQKSLWFCHGDVIPEGIVLTSKIKGIEGVDFWSEAPGHGRIVCTRVEMPQVNGNAGSVVTFNEWQTADALKILDEKRILHLVDLGATRLLIFDIDLHASVAPLVFGDTKEGSLGVRVRQELTSAKGKGTLTNAEGKVGELQCWGRVSAWCDDSGLIGNTTAGISILAHPNNSVPTGWHSRGYGLMAANPFARQKSGFPSMKDNKERVKLARGEHLKMRYGILLHQGNAADGQVAQMYEKFTAMKYEK